MVTQTTKIKNGTITLPKGIRKSWRGAEVLIYGEGDTLIIKRIQPPSFPEMLEEFRKIGKYITKKDVEDAIKKVRKADNYKK